MKLITRMLLMMLVILMGTGMTSCELFGISDNPLSPRLKVRVSEMTVQVGASRKCNVSASTRAKLLYASSDEKIATVDDKGIVTGVSEGDALITVVATNPEGTELFVEESGIIAVKVVAKGSEETEPEKEEVVTASELVAQAQDEGAIVIIWYFLEGNIQHAVFKKVGEDYVLQDENAASARANTRDAEGALLVKMTSKKSSDYKSNGFDITVSRQDKSKFMVHSPIATASVRDGKVKMQTDDPTTYVAAVGVSGNENNTNDNTNPIQKEDVSGSVLTEGATDPEMKDKLNKVDNMLAGEEDYNPDDPALNNVAFVTPDENSDDYKLVSSSEINQSLSNEDSPADVASKIFNELKLNIEIDVKTGKITLPKISFKENKLVTLNSDASKNTITQTATANKEGTITYAIYTDEITKNTCGATVDANSGKVTFTKLGSATIEATLNYGGEDYKAYYTLTVDKAEGSIEFEETEIYKLTTDEPFTIPLKKVGDGEVTYSSSNMDVAEVDGNGLVTIKGAGKTTIKAKVKDGNYYHYENPTVSYKLTVAEPNTIGPGGGYKKGGEI